jgi:hypothetical protein
MVFILETMLDYTTVFTLFSPQYLKLFLSCPAKWSSEKALLGQINTNPKW